MIYSPLFHILYAVYHFKSRKMRRMRIETTGLNPFFVQPFWAASANRKTYVCTYIRDTWPCKHDHWIPIETFQTVFFSKSLVTINLNFVFTTKILKLIQLLFIGNRSQSTLLLFDILWLIKVTTRLVN